MWDPSFIPSRTLTCKPSGRLGFVALKLGRGERKKIGKIETLSIILNYNRSVILNDLKEVGIKKRDDKMMVLRKASTTCISLRSSSSLLRCFTSSSASNVTATAATDVADEGILLVDSPPPPKIVNPSLLQPRVVVYDGVCHLCHGGVKWVIKADKHKKIKFCCLQSKAAEPYLRLCGVDREDVLRRFLFIEGPGLYHQASTAALRVASYLPLPYSALSAFLIIPTPLRDAIYDYVAKRRYDWFGKEEDCIVLQEKEMLERFIDREELIDGNNHSCK